MAAVWEQPGEITALGSLAHSPRISWGKAASADGTAVTGYSMRSNGQPEAFRWTALEGMSGLGDLIEGDPTQSYGFDISGDGQVVVGQGLGDVDGEFVTLAVRWTAQDGMTGLLDSSGNLIPGAANGVNSDGSIIVGWGFVNGHWQAFRWRFGQIQPLGDLPGGAFRSIADRSSEDGRVVIGGSVTGGETPDQYVWESFVWRKDLGMRNLRTVLTNAGLDLTGWDLGAVWDISADGTVVAGTGANPDGFEEGWVALVPGLGCSGDADGNGAVDLDDVTLTLGNFGTSAVGLSGDVDFDGDVDLDDLTILLRHLGETCSM